MAVHPNSSWAVLGGTGGNRELRAGRASLRAELYAGIHAASPEGRDPTAALRCSLSSHTAYSYRRPRESALRWQHRRAGWVRRCFHCPAVRTEQTGAAQTLPPPPHTHTAPSPFRIALWSFLPPHFRSSTTKPIPVPGVIYPFQPSTTCGRISQPANSQAFLNLQNKAKQNPAVLFSPHQMVFLQPTERCFPTVASRLSSQGVGSHPRRHIPSGGQNAPKPIQEPKLCPSKPKSRESQRGSAGKLLGDGGLGCWMPWARSTEHPEWGPRRIHPPPGAPASHRKGGLWRISSDRSSAAAEKI